jgi:Concanavalin A-like lectin/glucanases superfamily
MSAADAIGKTADKVGVGVEALQELRFAAPVIAFMTAAAAAQFRIGLNTSGQVFIQLGTSTILATSAEAGPVFAAGTWYYLEVEAFVHDTTGFVRVYRDGNLLVEAASVDTKGQASTDLVELIRFIGNNGGGTSDRPNIVSIDDVYVLDDSTRLGQCRVSTLLFNADTADADWTPLGAGDHFAEVDDDNGDTSYIASDTATDLDMFDVEDLPFTPQTVHAVQISWRAQGRRCDQGGPVQDQVGCRDGHGRHAHPDLELPLLPRCVRGRPRCRRAVDRGRRGRHRDRRRDGDLVDRI